MEKVNPRVREVIQVVGTGVVLGSIGAITVASIAASSKRATKLEERRKGYRKGEAVHALSKRWIKKHLGEWPTLVHALDGLSTLAQMDDTAHSSEAIQRTAMIVAKFVHQFDKFGKVETDREVKSILYKMGVLREKLIRQVNALRYNLRPHLLSEVEMVTHITTIDQQINSIVNRADELAHQMRTQLRSV